VLLGGNSGCAATLAVALVRCCIGLGAGMLLIGIPQRRRRGSARRSASSARHRLWRSFGARRSILVIGDIRLDGRTSALWCGWVWAVFSDRWPLRRAHRRSCLDFPRHDVGPGHRSTRRGFYPVSVVLDRLAPHNAVREAVIADSIREDATRLGRSSDRCAGNHGRAAAIDQSAY